MGDGLRRSIANRGSKSTPFSSLVRALNWQPGLWPQTDTRLDWGPTAYTTEWGLTTRCRQVLGQGRYPPAPPPPDRSTCSAPCTHLAVLQEGKEPLQLGHQGLRVVLGQTEHTVSETSKEGHQSEPRAPTELLLAHPMATTASGLDAGPIPVAQVWAGSQGGGAGGQQGDPAVPSSSSSP